MTKKKIAIRRARPDDAAAIAALMDEPVEHWEDMPLAPHGKVMVEASRLEPIAAKIRRAL